MTVKRLKIPETRLPFVNTEIAETTFMAEKCLVSSVWGEMAGGRLYLMKSISVQWNCEGEAMTFTILKRDGCIRGCEDVESVLRMHVLSDKEAVAVETGGSRPTPKEK